MWVPMSSNPSDSLFEAILAVQGEAPTLSKDKTATVKSDKGSYTYTYTALDTIVEQVGPILNKHGLVWMTMPSGTHDEPTLKYQLTHAATKEAIEGEMPLLLDKSSAQAMGSAITYTRRYSLCAVLNLVGDDDDDGQAAGTASRAVNGRAGRPSDAQKKFIEKLVKEKGATLEQLQVILNTIGADVEVKEGWLDLLSGGKEGTASELISFLKENPLPSIEHPSDVPEPGEDEFIHERQPPMETIE
jgi:hypothetical protein